MNFRVLVILLALSAFAAKPAPKAPPPSGPKPSPKPKPSVEKTIPVALPNYDEETSVKLQIFLDNSDFGPGKIDGRMGEFFGKALVHYKRAHGMAETGSVSFMWDRVGQVAYGPEAGSEDKVMDAAIEAGADDVESDEDGHTVYTAFEQLSDVAAALEAALGPAKSTQVAWRPKALTPASGDAAATLMKLLEALEDEDDVQNVYSNADISAEDLEKLAS